MFESIMNFFKNLRKTESKESKSKETAKERLHLVLMQDRANVSADFLEMMKQEIIDVIKKYIEVDEKEIDVRLTNEVKEDGTTGAPSLYANIPIVNIKNDAKKELEEKHAKDMKETKKEEEPQEEKVEEEEKAEEAKEEETETKPDEEEKSAEEVEEEKAEEVKEEPKEETEEEKVEEEKVEEEKVEEDKNQES